MTVYQNMNQFAQTPIKGSIAAIVNPTTLSVQIDINSGSTLYAGSAVKLVAGTANTILVDLAIATDTIFGFIIYNPKKGSFTAGDTVEIALPNSVIYLESYGAFNRGQNLEYYATGTRVTVSAGTNPIVGTALDTSTASGQLVRVYVRTVAEFSSSSSSSSCKSSSSSSSSG